MDIQEKAKQLFNRQNLAVTMANRARGVTIAEFQEQGGVTWDTARWTLQKLQSAGKLTSKKEEGRRRGTRPGRWPLVFRVR